MKPVARTDRGASSELTLCWGGRFADEHDVDWHEHAETELVVVTAGRCRIQVGDQEFAGDAGTLFILPAGVPQHQQTLESTKTTFVGFRFAPGLFDQSPRTLQLPENEPLRQWIEQLCDWPLQHPVMDPELGRQLLAISLRRIAELDRVMGRQSRQPPAVTQALQHIEQYLDEPIHLTDLARTAGVSVSHLVALFTKDCGISPMAYLQRRRLDRAAWLLNNPYLRIQEVAVACGYEDMNYFVRLFKRRFGQPPGRWRKRRFNPPKGS